MKRLEVACPRCFRKRMVGRTSMAGQAWWEEKRASQWLWCRTCQLLASVDKHKAAIIVLYKQIEERRMRGL